MNVERATQCENRDLIIGKVRIEENFVIWFLYRSTRPAANFLSGVRVSPNLITSAGLVLTGVVVYLTLTNKSYSLILATWYLVIFLDLVDGQVARISKKVREHSFRFDHTSDLLKTSFFLISLGQKYSSTILWLTISICLVAFLIADGLNAHISFNRPEKDLVVEAKNKSFSSVFRTNIYTIFFTYNTHTLLLFPLLVRNLEFAIGGVTYLVSISIVNGLRFIHVLGKLPRLT